MLGGREDRKEREGGEIGKGWQAEKEFLRVQRNTMGEVRIGDLTEIHV